MRKLKTLISVLLSAMLVLSLFAPAMADTTYSVTVNDAIVGETYNVYKIFDYIASEPSSTSGVYVANQTMYDLLTDDDGESLIAGVTFDGVDDENRHYVSIEDNATVLKNFTTHLLALIAAKSLTALDTQVAPDSKTVTFDDITEPGYYFVDTTAGTLCILNTTTPSISVNDKNTEVTVDKVLSEDQTNWAQGNNAQIGDTVHFKTTVTLQKGSEAVVLYDTMEPGLTFSNSVSVKVSGANEVLPETNYTFTNGGNDDAFTFKISFNQDYLNTITAATNVEVTYSAVVNKDATLHANTNDNTTWVEYGKESTTERKTTTTKVVSFNLFKYTGAYTEGMAGLAGAEFEIYKGNATSGNGSLITLIAVDENNYRVASQAEINDSKVEKTTKIVSTATTIVISGLDVDCEYYLKETKAPAGYNREQDNIPVAEGATKLAANGTTQVNVLNESGVTLPTTGGMGTKILFTVGGIMMVVAFVLITSKRRMSAEG